MLIPASPTADVVRLDQLSQFIETHTKDLKNCPIQWSDPVVLDTLEILRPYTNTNHV